MRRNEDEMDNQKLADLLFPEVVNTPEYYEEKFPYRKLPNKAEVTRMAPSPTGFIHLGNLYSALADERIAHRNGGVFYPVSYTHLLPVAIGLYLPLELSATIMIGGLIRHFVDKKSKDKDKDNEASGGILFCSGLIAGEGLVGILLAIFAVVGLADPIDLSGSISLGTIGSIVLMVIMVLLILKNAVWTKSKEK